MLPGDHKETIHGTWDRDRRTFTQETSIEGQIEETQQSLSQLNNINKWDRHNEEEINYVDRMLNL